MSKILVIILGILALTSCSGGSYGSGLSRANPTLPTTPIESDFSKIDTGLLLKLNRCINNGAISMNVYYTKLSANTLKQENDLWAS